MEIDARRPKFNATPWNNSFDTEDMCFSLRDPFKFHSHKSRIEQYPIISGHARMTHLQTPKQASDHPSVSKDPN